MRDSRRGEQPPLLDKRLSSLGLGFVMDARWLLPLTAVFLLAAVAALGFRARKRSGEVHDMRDAAVAARAKSLGIRSVPTVLVDGKLADCCAGRGPTEAVLRQAGRSRGRTSCSRSHVPA